ncbi:MAG: hypothetical protein A3G38_01120 [Omnitrophica WOR_2 bacterium RIFCSPLOWO2_12_FULL_51_8]|nr:MAG: hypothetical protein A3G38_01120 [Omnitrophica WOR_2 bacterium RIFCSPLOWO2_12_FULL_51_8]
MAKIKPFRAIIYNPEKIAELTNVVCPPYDVISPAQQKSYHSASPHNFIHILLGLDKPGEDKYPRAADFFHSWLKERILIRDDLESVYFYSQQYYVLGEKKTRQGVICLLRLPEGEKTVFGHEHTRLEAKEDRYRLIKEIKANLSPIFAVFQDKRRLIKRLSDKYLPGGPPPFIDIVDQEKVRHQLWGLSSPEAVAAVKNAMAEENIFIADGHHRYEVACAFRDEMKEKAGDKFTGEEDFNYIMTYFTNTDRRGLTIFPIHRLFQAEDGLDRQALQTRLKGYFDLEEVRDKDKFFFLLNKAGRTEHSIGMYMEREFWLLRLKNIKILNKLIPDKPESYRSLDVCILNYLIFKNILGVESDNKRLLCFSPNVEEILSGAEGRGGRIAFFLNPAKIEQIMAVALSGEKMPPKSTYFYPKVLSGLVIHKHG